MPARQTQKLTNIDAVICGPSRLKIGAGCSSCSASRIARKLTGRSTTPKRA
jgi:hypothetical protein